MGMEVLWSYGHVWELSLIGIQFALMDILGHYVYHTMSIQDMIGYKFDGRRWTIPDRLIIDQTAPFNSISKLKLLSFVLLWVLVFTLRSTAGFSTHPHKTNDARFAILYSENVCRFQFILILTTRNAPTNTQPQSTCKAIFMVAIKCTPNVDRFIQIKENISEHVIWFRKYSFRGIFTEAFKDLWNRKFAGNWGTGVEIFKDTFCWERSFFGGYLNFDLFLENWRRYILPIWTSRFSFVPNKQKLFQVTLEVKGRL